MSKHVQLDNAILLLRLTSQVYLGLSSSDNSSPIQLPNRYVLARQSAIPYGTQIMLRNVMWTFLGGCEEIIIIEENTLVKY